jgi:hypothetical protein
VFLFNLFEKKKQDTAASRFVGGTSQDARVKNALDNAYRAVPAAKSPEEAALGYIDIQNSLNQKQDQALDQQTKTNQQQTQQINDLVNDMRRKEKDFRDLNAQIADMPNVTPQQVAQMAQDIEASHDSEKGQPVNVSNVVNKRVATQASEPQQKTVYAPGPGASIAQQANYQKAKDQGAATADTKPASQATPAPAVTPPGRVIKGKNQSDALGQMAQQLTTQPAQQELPATNVRNIDQARAAKAAAAKSDAERAATLQASGLGTGTFGEQATGAGNEQIASDNESRLVKAYLGDTSVELVFLTGPVLPLNKQQVHAFVDAFAQIPAGPNKDALKTNLFSNRTFLIEWLFENIVNPATATNRPTDVDQNELNQGQLTLEGDVVPMTDNQTTNQAYADALTFLKRVYANPNDPMTTTMRQDFAHKYQQRFQISQAPDRSYYLLDKQLSKKYKLPTPDFSLEEEPYDGKSDWSDGKGQWSSENNLISSGNNPMGFSESADDIKKKMSKFEALALAANRAGDDDKCKMYQQKVQSLKQKLSQSMTEELGDSPVAGAITRRILMQRLDLLKQYGPELVGAAVDNVADYVGDVDEIGSSDVSGWVAQVERMLKENPPEAFSEGWSDAMVSQRTGQPRTPYSVYIKGKKWKDFENDDHARAVMDKLKAKFAADGRDPETITIAPTDMSEAIGKKDLVGQLQKDLPKVTDPKNKNAQPVAWTGPGKDDYGYTGYQGHGMPTDKQERDRTRADKKKGVAEGLLYSGDTWQDVLYRINVLNDIFGDQKDLAANFEPASQPEWIPFRDRILRSRTVLDTYAKVKQLANMNVPLTDVEIEMLADVAWDGGGGPVEPAGHWGERDYDWLEDLYAQQFAVVQHLLDQKAQGYGQNKTKSGQTVHEQGMAEDLKTIKGPHGRVDVDTNTPGVTKVSQKDRLGARNFGEPFRTGGGTPGMKTTNTQKGSSLNSVGAYKRNPTGRTNPKLDYSDGDQLAHYSAESVEEAETDYSKRRQRERDVDAGKPVSRQPKNPQTDYAKKRAKEKRDMALGETINYWTKLQNERNTKIASLVNELKESIEK